MTTETETLEIADDQEQKQTEANHAPAEGYDEQNPDSQPILEDNEKDGGDPINADLPGDGEGLIEAEEPNEGTTEAEDQLNKIQNQLLVVREKEADVDDVKKQLKFAKADYENAVELLLQLAQASKNDEDRPLFNQNNANEEDSDGNVDRWEDQTIDNLWESGPIKGLGDAKLESLVDECPKLGDFEKLRVEAGNENVHLSTKLPKGIGDAMADELEKRHLDLVSNFEPVATADEHAPEPFDLGAFIDDIITVDGWQEKIEPGEEFEQGKEDFLNGSEIEELQPAILDQFGEDKGLVQWCYGWASASAEHEAELESRNEPEEDEYEDVPDEDDLADL